MLVCKGLFPINKHFTEEKRAKHKFHFTLNTIKYKWLLKKKTSRTKKDIIKVFFSLSCSIRRWIGFILHQLRSDTKCRCQSLGWRCNVFIRMQACWFWASFYPRLTLFLSSLFSAMRRLHFCLKSASSAWRASVSFGPRPVAPRWSLMKLNRRLRPTGSLNVHTSKCSITICYFGFFSSLKTSLKKNKVKNLSCLSVCERTWH